MLIQAAGLAVLAAITPTALLVSAVFLGSASPRRTTMLFLASALVTTAILAVIIFFVLQAGHLSRPHHRQARYGLRLGLGLLILLAGVYLLRRRPKKKDPARQGKGFISRLIARPSPRAAFLAGLIVYSPSLTFFAAIQVVATARASSAADAGGIALVIAITLLFVWLPLGLHFVAPERTGRTLTAFNEWLRSHGHVLLVAATLLAGAVVTIDGILGLTGAIS